MNYIVQNDLYYLWKEKKKMIFLYLICIIAFALMGTDAFQTKEEAFQVTSGLLLKDTASFSLLIYFFHTLFFLYLAYYLILHDIENGINSIFCRMNYRKWMKHKFLSIFLVDFFFRTISFLLIGILLFYSYDLSSFLISITLIMIIQLFLLISYLIQLLIKGIPYIITLGLFLFLLFVKPNLLSVFTYTHHWYILLLVLLTELFLFRYLLKRNISLLLERGN